MRYEYEIGQFYWVKSDNTFYADAWNLIARMPDGSIHPEAFPNGKKEFYIVNPKTGNERRFRFVNEFEAVHPAATWSESVWQFKSEDGILCNICVGEN